MGTQSTSSAWEADDWVACTPATVSRPWDGEPTPLQLALARGHHWFAMLESDEVKSLREIARRDGVDSSYVSRMALSLDLTLFGLALDPLADE